MIVWPVYAIGETGLISYLANVIIPSIIGMRDYFCLNERPFCLLPYPIDEGWKNGNDGLHGAINRSMVVDSFGPSSLNDWNNPDAFAEMLISGSEHLSVKKVHKMSEVCRGLENIQIFCGA